MKKLYSFLLLATLMLFAPMKANAQTWEAPIVQDFQKDWANDVFTISLTDVATYFETDTTTLRIALDAFNAADPASFKAPATEPELYFTTTVDEVTYPNANQSYSAEQNGFWMKEDGTPLAFGDDGYAWYAFTTADGANDAFDIHVGQLPNHFVDGATLSSDFVLHYKGKEATFQIRVTVNPKPVVGDVLLSGLTIVKDYELPLDFTYGREHEGLTYSTTLDGIYDALGMTAEELDAVVADVTYTQLVEGVVDEESGLSSYSWVDKLELPADASGGAWFGRYANYNETTGEDEFLEMNAPHSWSTNATFYAQNITLTEGEFSIVSGQYPGTFKVGDTDYAYLYIVNGSKAARIKVQVSVSPRNAEGEPDLETYTKVGEGNLEQLATKISDYWQITTPISNIEEIGEKLEVENLQDITKWVLEVDGGTSMVNTLDDNWGTWVNENGVKSSWGQDAVFMVAFNNTELGDGSYVISTLQNYSSGHEVLKDKTTYTFPVYLCNENNGTYYQLNIVYSIDIPEISGEWQKVYTAAYDVQLISAEGYAQNASCKTQLDMTSIETAIGTSSPSLFGEKWSTNDAGETSMKYSDDYSCTPHPGFWMSEDGKSVASWGDTSAYGMTYANGVITYYAYPNARTTGQEFDSNFYLVNEATGKYALISLHIIYVDERGELATTVGSSDITFTLADENINGDGAYVNDPFDWTPVYEALEITADDVTDCDWQILNQSGRFMKVPYSFEGENNYFDALGLYYDIDLDGNDPENALYCLGYDEFANQFTCFWESETNLPEDGVLYTTKVALVNADKLYEFNITMATAATMTGIKDVTTGKNATDCYDLSGRRILNPVKGLYIQNGKKYLVK